MRKLLWVGVLFWAGCSGGPGTDPTPAAAAGACACANKVCVCAHCAPEAKSGGCPCKAVEKPR